MNKQCLPRMAIAFAVASTCIASGCQQLGFQARDSEFRNMLAEQDDWEPPQSSSQVPRPNLNDLRAQNRRDRANSPVPESRYGNKQNYDVTSGPSKVVQRSTDESSAPKSTNIEGLDVEGDIASLPAGYRDFLLEKLSAFQKQESAKETASTAKAIESKSETRSLSDDQSKKTNSEQKLENPAGNSERGSGKVSFRVSDSVAEDHQSLTTATSIAPNSSDSKVSTAIATTGTSMERIDPSASPIITASAVAPAAGGVSNVQMPSPTGSLPSTASSANWRQLLGQAVEKLEKEIKETPASDVNLRNNQEISLRMFYVIQRRLEDATRPIDVLSDSEKDYFAHQMHALFEASNPDAMPVRSRHCSLVMNIQRKATDHLAVASNLEVKSLAFCTEVERYGVISKFPKYQFQADQELLLYCEIENVAANEIKGQGFESQLQGSYEIIDSQGRKVADQLLPMEPEICQNHRRDYFMVYKIFMPQQIASGNYQLRLTVEDMKARKFGQNHLDFQIKK